MNFSKAILAAALMALVACGDESSVNNPQTTTDREVGKPMKVDAGTPSSCAPSGDSLVQITSPAKGAVLVPGDAVVVRWRSAVADFQGYDLYVSLDGGATWEDFALNDASILPVNSGPESQCFSFETIVPLDGSYTPEGKDNKAVLFRVKDYSSSKATMRASTDSLTVLAP